MLRKVNTVRIQIDPDEQILDLLIFILVGAAYSQTDSFIWLTSSCLEVIHQHSISQIHFKEPSGTATASFLDIVRAKRSSCLETYTLKCVLVQLHELLL